MGELQGIELKELATSNDALDDALDDAAELRRRMDEAGDLFLLEEAGPEGGRAQPAFR